MRPTYQHDSCQNWVTTAMSKTFTWTRWEIWHGQGCCDLVLLTQETSTPTEHNLPFLPLSPQLQELHCFLSEKQPGSLGTQTPVTAQLANWSRWGIERGRGAVGRCWRAPPSWEEGGGQRSHSIISSQETQQKGGGVRKRAFFPSTLLLEVIPLKPGQTTPAQKISSLGGT